MQTWQLPEPPDESITEVHDADGAEYRRASSDGQYWTCIEPARKRGTYHWSDLLYQRGPVTAEEA